MNKHYELEGSDKKFLIKKGDIISIKINLIYSYIYFFINTKIIKNNKMKINNGIGY